MNTEERLPTFIPGRFLKGRSRQVSSSPQPQTNKGAPKLQGEGQTSEGARVMRNNREVLERLKNRFRNSRCRGSI